VIQSFVIIMFILHLSCWTLFIL